MCVGFSCSSSEQKRSEGTVGMFSYHAVLRLVSVMEVLLLKLEALVIYWSFSIFRYLKLSLHHISFITLVSSYFAN